MYGYCHNCDTKKSIIEKLKYLLDSLLNDGSLHLNILIILGFAPFAFVVIIFLYSFIFKPVIHYCLYSNNKQDSRTLIRIV